jgi:hypothetical protein
MSDVVERANAVTEGITDGPWVVNREGWACISSGSDSVFHGYFDGSCDDCGDEIHDAASVAISIEDAEFIAAARQLVPELVAEVKRLRSYKSLPEGMVWQDYYSPNDVIKIRTELEAEIDRLRTPGPHHQPMALVYHCALSDEFYPALPEEGKRCEVCPWGKGEADIEIRAASVCLPVDEFRERNEQLS